MEVLRPTINVSLGDNVRISDDVVFRELDGEAVILNLETGIYFGLNGTGTRVWNHIGQQGSLQRVFDTMAAEYEIHPQSLQEDLLRLVGELCEKGLVRVESSQR